LALAVPLSRFVSRVGGGSAFFVRPNRTRMKTTTLIFLCLTLNIAVGWAEDFHLKQTQIAYTPGVTLESLTRYVLELPDHHSQTFTNFASKAMMDAVASLPRGSVLYYDGSGLIAPPKQVQIDALEAFCKKKGIGFINSPTN